MMTPSRGLSNLMTVSQLGQRVFDTRPVFHILFYPMAGNHRRPGRVPIAGTIIIEGNVQGAGGDDSELRLSSPRATCSLFYRSSSSQLSSQSSS
jgi:hypothetical protein